jgi:hypothetical protein
MDTIQQNLHNWRASLVTNIPIDGLMSRNSIAYKWKAPFRCWLLREATFRRVTDLLTQSCSLHQQGHGLGARILLRSGFETLALLIYLNHKMRAVIEGKLNFHKFCDLTDKLVRGSKSDSQQPIAVNILSMLDDGDRKYRGLRNMYDNLSESAHPNFEGLVWGYTKVNHDEYKTIFSNRWMDLYGGRHLKAVELNSPEFSRRLRFSFSSAVRTRRATASRS